MKILQMNKKFIKRSQQIIKLKKNNNENKQNDIEKCNITIFYYIK